MERFETRHQEEEIISLLPEREIHAKRERIRKKIQKKILAIVFGGFIASGFVSSVPTQRIGVGEQPETKPKITRTIEAPVHLKTGETAELQEIKTLVAELDKKVDTKGYLMDFMQSLEEDAKENPTIDVLSILRQKPRMAPEETTNVMPLPVVNFEKAGLRSEELSKFINERYPSSWKYHLVSLEFTDTEEPMPEAYGEHFRGSYACGAAPEVGLPGSPSAIQFFKGCGAKEIIEVLHHELAHTVDWDRNQVLSGKEKLILLKKILSRIDAEDRYISHYVERIDPKDPQSKNYFRAKEYWAEIMEEYLSHPPYYWNGGKDPGRLSGADLEVIRWFLAKTDPRFDVKKARDIHADYTAIKITGDTMSHPKLFIQNSDG